MNRDIDRYIDLITAAMEAVPLDREPRALYEPVDYCLKNGGKRIRPLMTLLACDMFGGNINEALPPAVGLELFHNFTLIHDDIMDNAPLRRNQPTVYKKWNTSTAILSGDVLFAIAGKFIARVPDKVLRQVIDLYHQTVTEVCEGQQYDMDFETQANVTTDEYMNMIRLKTAVLPAACLKTGAIIAGAPGQEQNRIYRFGESVGLAFQLRDDWLDVFGESTEFGKQTGGDIIANKKTWLTIKALELSDSRQRQTLKEVFSGSPDNDDGQKVQKVKEIYQQLDIGKLAQETMENHYTEAIRQLGQVDVPGERKIPLEDLARQLLSRKK